ncbi:MAG: hypothetical protein RLZZ387_436, partial [Chloroflexota bacterium]
TGVPGRCDFDTGPLGQAFAVARGGDVLTYTLRLHALPDRATAGVTGTLTFGDLWYKDELISATSSQGQITPGAPGTWTFALDLGTLEAGQDAVVTVAVRPVDWEGRRGSAVGTTVMIALAGAGATRSYQLDVRAPDSVLPAALPTPRQYLPLLRRS